MTDTTTPPPGQPRPEDAMIDRQRLAAVIGECARRVGWNDVTPQQLADAVLAITPSPQPGPQPGPGPASAAAPPPAPHLLHAVLLALATRWERNAADNREPCGTIAGYRQGKAAVYATVAHDVRTLLALMATPAPPAAPPTPPQMPADVAEALARVTALAGTWLAARPVHPPRDNPWDGWDKPQPATDDDIRADCGQTVLNALGGPVCPCGDNTRAGQDHCDHCLGEMRAEQQAAADIPKDWH